MTRPWPTKTRGKGRVVFVVDPAPPGEHAQRATPVVLGVGIEKKFFPVSTKTV